MISKEELIITEEYWLETLQNEVYRMIAGYIEKEGITQIQFAKKLGVSKGYISQIMNGNFNYTLKKLIELSLAVGKAPVIEFKSFDDIIESTHKKAISQAEIKLNKVAEPKVKYKS
jgi:transcriptional regulator with XRE-family HTH domain